MIALPVLDAHDPPVRVDGAARPGLLPAPLLPRRGRARSASPTPRVFAGRQLHAALEADEDGEAVSLELTSPALGLTGKVDCLRRRDGSLPPLRAQARPAAPARRQHRPTPGPPIACRSSPTPSCSKRPSASPSPRAASATTPPTSPSACPSTTPPAPTCTQAIADARRLRAVRRAAAHRRQRTALRALLAGPGLPARGGPPGARARARPRPPLPARPRRRHPARRRPGRPGRLQRRQPGRPAARPAGDQAPHPRRRDACCCTASPRSPPRRCASASSTASASTG